MITAFCMSAILQIATTELSELPAEEARQLKAVIAEAEPGLFTAIDSQGFPRQYIDIPQEFLKCYRDNPKGTVSVLIDVIERGPTDDAHMAYILAVVRDGRTEGRQGLAYRNHREIDMPDGEGVTTRSRWAKYARTLYKNLDSK